MPVPTFETYLLPILKQYKNGNKMHIKDVRNLVAKELNLTQEDLEEMTQGGNEYKHNDRVYWSRTYLSKSGLLEGARGFYTITDEGKKLLNENPSTLSRKDLERYESFREFKSKKTITPNVVPVTTTEIEDADPKEILLTSLNEINEALAL
ncbi:MAG: winged helix-turn-helix domain-containing protein, partial [Candidatus Puniceispirillales bacterium]